MGTTCKYILQVQNKDIVEYVLIHGFQDFSARIG